MTALTLTRTITIAAALLVVLASLPARPSRAAGDSPKRLIYATYKNETSAMDVFKALKSAEDKDLIKLDSYAMISKGLDGKVKVKDQRQKGTRTGAVIGALVGLLGGPMGAVAGAAAGGMAGYLTGDAVGMSKDTVDLIKRSLDPGESAIIIVVDEKWAATAQKMQEAKAARITTESIPFVKESGAEGASGKSDVPPPP